MEPSVVNEAKYSTLYKTLKNDILSGKYASGKLLPSENALTRRFKVCRSTVQQAFRELEKMGLISRSRGCGTFVTKRGASRKIGLILPGVAYCEIYPPIVSEISRLTQEGGYKLLLGDIPCTASDEWSCRATKVAEEFVAEQVAGVIFQPFESGARADECNAKVLSLFGKAGIPVVLIGYDIVCSPDRSGYDVVGINNFDAGARMAQHLVDTGSKRIHFFRSPDCDSPSGRNRFCGIAAVLGARRFSAEKNVLEAAADDAARIKRHFRKNRPDAIVCGNDSTAAALRQTLMRIGVRVPGDVRLAGFDDVNIARLTQLTTVRQPCESMARTAFRRLLERIGDPTIDPVEIFLPARLVIRESTQGQVKQRRNTMKTLIATAAIAILSISALGENHAYFWDAATPQSEYGDGRVVVTYENNKVKTLTATAAEGDVVRFEGAAMAVAADATFKIDGRGTLVFANDVAADGAVAFTSDSPMLVYEHPTDDFTALNVNPASPTVLAFPGVMNLDEYAIRDCSTVGYAICAGAWFEPAYYPVRTADSYEAQFQYLVSDTFCCELKVQQRADGIALSYPKCRYANGKNVLGQDFRTLPDLVSTYLLKLKKVRLQVDRVQGIRRIAFDGAFTSGALTIADGVNVRLTSSASGVGSDESFETPVVFDNGLLEFYEPGSFTYAGAISGSYGDIIFSSADEEHPASDYVAVYEADDGIGIPSTDTVIFRNVALSSITGMTARIDWRYNSQPDLNKTGTTEEFRGDLRPMYYKADPYFGTMAVARFQAFDGYSKTLAKSIPIVLTQVGDDVAVRKVDGATQWVSIDPGAADPWTWEPKNYGDYKCDTMFFITNLTCSLSQPVGIRKAAATADIQLKSADSTQYVNVLAKPGAGRQMTVRIAKSKGFTSRYGSIHAFAGTEFRIDVGETGLYGAFAANKWPPTIYIHEGARGLATVEGANSSYQDVVVSGGAYGLVPASAQTSWAYGSGKLLYTGGSAVETLNRYNFIANVRYENGGRTFGARMRVGYQDANTKPTVTVAGGAPAVADNGFLVSGASGSSANPNTFTFDVADVTGDARTDYTVNYLLYEEGKPALLKRGAGTMLLTAQSAIAKYPVTVEAGELCLGCDDCLGTAVPLRLTGGTVGRRPERRTGWGRCRSRTIRRSGFRTGRR